MTCECHTEIQKKQTNKDKNKIVTVPEWWLEVAIMSIFFFNHVSQAKNLDQQEKFLKENKQSQNMVA